MRRYQVAPDPAFEPFVKAPKEHRFENIDDAMAVAAWRMSRALDDPPHFVIDITNQKPVGAADLVRVCGILAAKDGTRPGDLPIFTDANGNVHWGISAIGSTA